jgi:hypothetical protein
MLLGLYVVLVTLHMQPTISIERDKQNWWHSGPLHTRDWEPMTIKLQALSLVERRSQSKFSSHYAWGRDQPSTWMQDGCKVYMDSYMASNGSCFMVTWIIFKQPPLRGKPNTKPEDHGTLNAHNHWSSLFYHVCGPTWINIHWKAFGWGPGHTRLHTTLEGPWPHCMILEVCWDDILWTLSFGLSQFHGHGSWLLAFGPLTYTIFSVVSGPARKPADIDDDVGS